MDLGLIGGFSYLGEDYKENPIEIIHAIDNDKYSVDIYNQNFSHKAIHGDIKESRALKVHDILIGGFPCKSFSIVAQNPPRLGYKNEEGKLFFEMVRLLKNSKPRPRFFIAENVKGILSANNRMAFPLIKENFKKAGYYIKDKLLLSSDFGVPQKRQRVFIIGFKNKKDYGLFKFPEKVYGSKKVLGDVIDISREVDNKYYFSDKAVNGMLKSRHKMNKGRVMDLDKPCNTINSHLSKVSLNSTDPVLFYNNKYRRFTPREAANIQSFPKSFVLNGVSENRQYISIGNAVPPVMMWHLTQSLLRILKKQ